MQLLIVRHGIAEEREEFAASGRRDDALRPLTEEGKSKMERNAAALRRVVDSLDVVGASPLLRARQTAAILAAAYGGLEVTTVPALVPGSPLAEFLAWLRVHGDAERAAVVGHEPHLSTLVTWLMCGVQESRVSLRKGGACLLELDAARAEAGGATLLWALTPALLRRIGD